ncbi:MAG TPA: ABC transporter permease subunit [Holophagaceae bacterium]|nr:ABC transporter permease subunit [Holophagaceae bacterium]
MLGWIFGGDGAVDLAHRLEGPTRLHWLGTDEVGRDLLARAWLGGARSLSVGLVLTALHLACGAAAAFAVHPSALGRRSLLAFADTLASVPATLLALLVMALARPGYAGLLLALAIGGWIPYARLSLVSLDAWRGDASLVQSRLMGGGALHRVRAHLLPRLAPLLLAQASVGLGAVILVEGGLSFLGVGLPPDRASWGAMLAGARAFLLVSPWGLLWPSLGLLGLLLSFSRLGRRGLV